MQGAKHALDAARLAVKELHMKKAATSTAVTAAEAEAASVRRRLPRLDADKRAAAAAKVTPCRPTWSSTGPSLESQILTNYQLPAAIVVLLKALSSR